MLFRQAISRAPRDQQYESYAGLIDVLRRSRQPAEIVRVCDEGLRTTELPYHTLFSISLSQAQAELGDAAKALDAADKAIATTPAPNRRMVNIRKVQVLKTLGHWDEAVALCRKLLDAATTTTDRHEFRYALASALQGAKKWAEAEAELRTILNDDPDHAGACNDLGHLLAEQSRNLPEAERLVRRAIAADRIERRKAGNPEPENATYLGNLGWVLFRCGNVVGAKEQLEKAAALPDGAVDGEIWDHLGDVYFQSNEPAKAKFAWETAAKLFSGDPQGKREGRAEWVAEKLKRIP
jgi:tetratricopeptide (TPR) repeat protein